MAVGGPTIAVVANGVDVAYPQGNAKLFGWIAEHGLVVSELPPGTHPSRVRFLARNRLIAGAERRHRRGRGGAAFGRAEHGRAGRSAAAGC